jgi:type II secretory pathway pseudopilin PulG
MMGRGKKSAPRTVLLPWEGRRAWLAELRSGRRIGAMLLGLALAGLVVWAFAEADARARVRTTRAAIGETRRAVIAFRSEIGRCPRSVVELVHPPKSGARYVEDTPVDGWGRELMIRCPGRLDPSAADVISAGPSGSFAIDDNVL